MTEITDATLIQAAREVIAERGPDFVYHPILNPNYDPDSKFPTPENSAEKTCLYSADEGKTGSCGVGAVLIEKLGIEYDPRWENNGVYVVLERLGVLDSLDPDTVAALESFQGVQDTEHPYSRVGEAFEQTLFDGEVR